MFSFSWIWICHLKKKVPWVILFYQSSGEQCPWNNSWINDFAKTPLKQTPHPLGSRGAAQAEASRTEARQLVADKDKWGCEGQSGGWWHVCCLFDLSAPFPHSVLCSVRLGADIKDSNLKASFLEGGRRHSGHHSFYLFSGRSPQTLWPSFKVIWPALYFLIKIPSGF